MMPQNVFAQRLGIGMPTMPPAYPRPIPRPQPGPPDPRMASPMMGQSGAIPQPGFNPGFNPYGAGASALPVGRPVPVMPPNNLGPRLGIS